MTSVSITATLPLDTERERYPVLYLFHGAFDDAACWTRKSNFERYAEEAGIAVVMPSVGNSFYTDMANGLPWFTFVTEELPKFAQKVLPVSGKREERFVGGLSMGGYGAMKAALTRPALYSAAAVMSGVMVIENTFPNPLPGISPSDIFGDLATVTGGKHDLFYLLESCKNPPRIYHTCGTEDLLYADNIKFRDAAQKRGVDYVYTEESGGHEWDFWDRNIRKILQWLR
jgi:S-formylglutathione hydrolase FrmB